MSKNKNYDLHCPNCGKYLVCNYCSPRTIYGSDNGIMTILYRCGDCRKYLPLKMFPADKTKKYRIRNVCKKCRSKQGNGN
jgi:hypothetical protein